MRKAYMKTTSATSRHLTLPRCRCVYYSSVVYGAIRSIMREEWQGTRVQTGVAMVCRGFDSEFMTF